MVITIMIEMKLQLAPQLELRLLTAMMTIPPVKPKEIEIQFCHFIVHSDT
jgi:hypothetical protein